MSTRIQIFDAAGATNQWPVATPDPDSIYALPRTTTAFSYAGTITDGPHAGENFVATYRGHMRPATNVGTVDSMDLAIFRAPIFRIDFDDPVGFRTYNDDLDDRLKGDTVFLGNASANQFSTSRGDDVLLGRAGSDSLYGAAGDDRLNGGFGSDLLHGGAGADVLIGGSGDDFFVGDGRDRIVEARGGGSDVVVATASLRLPDNVEYLGLVEAARDGWGNALRNTITGNNHANVLRGLDGGDTIDGDLGADTVLGGNGNDALFGHRGQDALSGGAGSDLLLGGPQADWLSGGAGRDRFVFESVVVSGPRAAMRDTIADFTRGDILDLSDIDARSDRAGNNAFDFIGTRGFTHVAGQLHYAGGLVTADVNGDGRADLSIALVGAPALGADDFAL